MNIKDPNIEIIAGLNAILKELYATLIFIYKDKFPFDTIENNCLKVGTILNELVGENLRGGQVIFKNNNTEFINKEKTRLLEMEKIRKGVLSFLIAKGALYKSWARHTDSKNKQAETDTLADIWINKARELKSNVVIPGTLDEISRVIERYFLAYYDLKELKELVDEDLKKRKI